MRRAAIYLRTSTAEQAERFGPAAQEAACRRYAAQESLEVVKVYQDEISGAESNRPHLKQLLKDSGHYHAIIIYHHDRLSRDVPLSYRLLETFGELGLELHATNTGRLERGLNFGIHSLMAEEERRRILERTYAGRVAKATRGQAAAKIDAYGYRYTKRVGTVEIDPQAAEVIRRIYQAAGDGKSWRAIALMLTREGINPPRRQGAEWSPNAVAYMVRNPVYKGEFQFGRVRTKKLAEPIPMAVPAIVSPEVWGMAQRGKRVFTSRNGTHALTGHLYCGLCGGTMSGKSTYNGYKRYSTYACTRRGRVGEPHNCTAPQISAIKLEGAVEESLRQAIAVLQPPPSNPEKDKTKLLELDAEDARWLDAFRKKAVEVDELAEARRDIQKRRLQIVKANSSQSIDVGQLKELAQGLPLAKLLRLTRARVIVHPGGKVDLELLGGTV